MSGANPIVLIPGFMGSRLSRVRDNRLIWIDPLWAATNASTVIRDLALRTPDDPKLYPSGVLHDVELGDWLRVGIYRQLHTFAMAPDGLGLAPSDYHEFAYDWRKSTVEAARELDATLLGFGDDRRPVTLIAHSMGGLVAAKLFESAGPGSRRVGKLVAVGCPFAGLLKTIDMLERGSAVLDLLFPGDPIRDLLGGMPGVYELMPSRTQPPLFLDAQGAAATPFSCADTLPARRYDRALLAAAEKVVGTMSLHVPVPLRVVEGYGVRTAVSARVGNDEITVRFDIQGDGTCPSLSLLAATGTAANGEPAVRVFSIPFGEHVALVHDPAFLRFLRQDLVPGEAPTPQISAAIKNLVAIPGSENLLIVETRNEIGGPLGTGTPSAAFSDGTSVALRSCEIAGEARWLGEFQHPASITSLDVHVPGIPDALQPARIHVFG